MTGASSSLSNDYRRAVEEERQQEAAQTNTVQKKKSSAKLTPSELEKRRVERKHKAEKAYMFTRLTEQFASKTRPSIVKQREKRKLAKGRSSRHLVVPAGQKGRQDWTEETLAQVKSQMEESKRRGNKARGQIRGRMASRSRSRSHDKSSPPEPPAPREDEVPTTEAMDDGSDGELPFPYNQMGNSGVSDDEDPLGYGEDSPIGGGGGGADEGEGKERNSADKAAEDNTPWWQRFHPAKPPPPKQDVGNDDDMAAQFGYGDDDDELTAAFGGQSPTATANTTWGSAQYAGQAAQQQPWGQPAVNPLFQPRQMNAPLPPQFPPPAPGAGGYVQQQQPPPPPPRAPPPSTLILSNIPSDVSLPALFQHCQKYGEVSGVHCKLEEGNATVEFTNRQSAIAMMAEPVLGHPEIQVKWQVTNLPPSPPTSATVPQIGGGPSPSSGRVGGGKGGGGGPGGKGFRQQQPRHTGNLVLENAEHQQQRAAREAKHAQEMQRVAVLSRMSETVKQLLAKLTDDKTSEAQKEKYKKLLGGLGEKVKEQMHSLSEDMQKEKAEKAKARDAAIRARYAGMQALQKNQSKESQDRMTLDNRPRAILLEEMDSDFDSVPVVMEYFRVLDVKGVRDFIWREESCIVRFESRWGAEEFVKQSSKYPFKCSYLANETADAAAKVTEPTQPLPPEAGAVIGAEIPEDDEQPQVVDVEQQQQQQQQTAEPIDVGEDEDRPEHPGVYEGED
ncbi:hypothetical protein FOL47_003304 [Perkinsus chesapeaki]|uniref:RRM domain-containing protein n=1 Tax=Perkinsus chesapeaki TaxID=330153 RepID=A0A7J6N074_PERCH|nr:hypothetical protein FOL47_003304 [Perkinsus chesapeaki]